MGVEVPAEAEEAELVFGDDAVLDHPLAGANVGVGVRAGVADVDQPAVRHPQPAGALDGDDVRLPPALQPDQLLPGQPAVPLDLGAGVVTGAAAGSVRPAR